MDKALAKLYYEASGAGSFGGVERLYQRALASNVAGVTRDKVRAFLATQQAYKLHRPARRHYKRNSTCASGIDRQWQDDLADMRANADENDGARYILTEVDVFSKYAWAVKIKKKYAATATAGFAEVVCQAAPRCPARLQTDKGLEFLNSQFAALIKRHKIEHIAKNSNLKTA